MNKNAGEISKGLDETLKQINEDEKSQTSKIQMDFVQPQMKSMFNRIGRWQVRGVRFFIRLSVLILHTLTKNEKIVERHEFFGNKKFRFDFFVPSRSNSFHLQDTAKTVEKSVDTFVNGVKDISREVKDVFNSVTKHQTSLGAQASIPSLGAQASISSQGAQAGISSIGAQAGISSQGAQAGISWKVLARDVTPNSSPLAVYDFNQQGPKHTMLAQSLGSFATDFYKIFEEIERILRDVAPTVIIIKKVVVIADTNGDIKEAKKQAQQVSDSFKKIKDTMEDASGLFKRMADDFGGVTDNFEKNGREPTIERKPISEEPRKREEPKPEKTEPKPQTEPKPEKTEPKPQTEPKQTPKGRHYFLFLKALLSN